MFVITRTIRCPYCDELIDTCVDTSAGDQRYVEDCYVCCRPIHICMTTDDALQLVALEVMREDD